ncbi:MAG: biopolymer transport protein TolQ [Lysobacterales bacterium]|jgi:biopolymer transport protein TolQ
MESELQVWQLVLDASWMVKFVMLILLFASVASWMIIFRKRQMLRSATRGADQFEERFWSGTDLAGLNAEIEASEQETNGLEMLFQAGFNEFNRMLAQGRMTADQVVEGAERAMRIALARETDRLEQHLSFLATVGSTSPYIGLFGTVWGIMTSFHALANVNQATIAMVAPGISEALVATAMGLFAAIPAVIAYNKYSNQVERLEVRNDNFKEEFSSVLQRQAHSLSGD